MRCPTYAHVIDGKPSLRAIKFIFLSYACENKGYSVSTSTDDQENIENGEWWVPVNVPQPYSSSEVHLNEPNSSPWSLDEPSMEDTYSISHARTQRAIRKLACYGNDNKNMLIAHGLAVS